MKASSSSSSTTKRVVHMRAHAQKRTISGGCTQAGSLVSSSSGPKIMVVISCTVGKGISTGWMDAIFFPSAKIHLEILECVMCVSVLEKRC